MKPQSKSKTFPKGTDTDGLQKWVKDQLNTRLVDGENFAYDKLREKYLITIIRYPESEEGKK